ncbi:DUF2383 domain-containing protein [Tamlana haliotis]|uniref:DUF2383 domain-containing protein n=1 Tax=Pseudotamlana haliotis TaxID=2614804 RepID=A0A6N6MBM9_9FLAO|nr:DUF2383 domain-containing protein [Tamlana haliotis]KAB1067986.1 DUF2383 domain-containing protein [Tamlana haliotis]
MKNNSNILLNLNSLLVMNYEAEKVYVELVDNVDDDELIYFFKENSAKRKTFIDALKSEILKLDGDYNTGVRAPSELYHSWLRIRKLMIKPGNDEGLIREIRATQTVTIEKYNDLLRMLGLPLSVCKLLMIQRDVIQNAKDAIDRHDLITFN